MGLKDEIPCSSWGRAAFLLQLFLPAAGMCPRMGFQDSPAQNEVPNNSVAAFPKAGVLIIPVSVSFGAEIPHFHWWDDEIPSWLPGVAQQVRT